MVDPDWGELIRSELDSYVPERLPARFVPGARRQRRTAMVDWRPVAITLGVLLLGLGFATIGGGPENIYRSVTQMSPSRNVTPSPAVTSIPSPEQTTRGGSVPRSPNPARTGPTPAASPPGSSPAPAPSADPPSPASPQGAVPAQPAPSPSSQCLVICLSATP